VSDEETMSLVTCHCSRQSNVYYTFTNRPTITRHLPSSTSWQEYIRPNKTFLRERVYSLQNPNSFPRRYSEFLLILSTCNRANQRLLSMNTHRTYIVLLSPASQSNRKQDEKSKGVYVGETRLLLSPRARSIQLSWTPSRVTILCLAVNRRLY